MLNKKLKEYNSKANGLVISARSKAARVRGDLYIPDSNKATILRQEGTKSLNELRESREAFDTYATIQRRKMALNMAKTFRPSKPNVAQDEAVWRRCITLLDSGISAEAVINDAADRGDADTVRVMEQEYRPYVWSKDPNGTPPDPADQDALFSEAKYATGGPEYQALADELAEFDKGVALVSMNYAAAERDVDPDSPDSHISRPGSEAVLMNDSGAPLEVDPTGAIMAGGDSL